MTYGERFKYFRLKLWDGRILELAQRLGKGYPSSVTNIERSWRVPNLTTLDIHATVLGVDPWELLEGVETEYDTVRSLKRLSPKAAESKWHDLLRRYQASTRRQSGGTRGRQSKTAGGERSRSSA